MSSREILGSDYLDGDGPRGAEPISPGVRLGDRYRILNVTGRGGFGAVMVAFDERLQREVAIKVAPDDSDVARLLREAEVTAHLDHPGIVAVHDLGLDEHGRPWYAMRVVRGQAATHIFATQRARGLRVLLAAAEAVAHAHRRGVAHGDLSPANIMIGEHGEVQVVDWGLAEKCDGAAGPYRPAGTPRYMSRERIAGARPSRHGDVYALGVMLGELGDRRREIAAIAARATHEAGEGYADAGAFAADLQRFFDGEVIDALDYRLVDHLARWWRARRAVMVTALIGIAVVTAIGVSSVHALIDERDAAIAAREDARRHLGESLQQRALELAQRGDEREALAVARQARAIAATPETAGVIAAFAGNLSPTLIEASALPRCRRVGRGPGASWCDDGEQLTWWSQDGAPVRQPGHFRDVVILAEHVVATTFDDRLVTWTRAGATLPPLTTLGSRNLRAGPDDRLAIGWEAYYIELVSPGSAAPYRRVAMCSHDHPITAVACARSPALVCAAACEGGDIDELEVANGPRTPEGRSPDDRHVTHLADADVVALALTPELDRLIGYRRGGVSFVAHDGRVHWHIASADGVNALELAPSGRQALLIDERQHHRLLSLTTGDATTPLAPALTTGGLTFEGDDLVAFGVMRTRWRLAQRPTTLHTTLGVSALAISSDAALLARGDRAAVAIIDATTGEVRRTITPTARMVKALAFEATNHDLAIAVTDAPRVVVVDADTGLERATIDGAPGTSGFRRLGWLGRTLVAARYDETIVTLDRTTDATRTWPVANEIMDMSFGADVVMIDRVGTILRFTGHDAPRVMGQVTKADVVVASEPIIVARGAHLVGLDGTVLADLGAPVVELVATADTLIAGLASGVVLVLDRATHAPRWSFAGHHDRVAALAPVGDTLWSAGWDGVVRRYLIDP